MHVLVVDKLFQVLDAPSFHVSKVFPVLAIMLQREKEIQANTKLNYIEILDADKLFLQVFDAELMNAS